MFICVLYIQMKYIHVCYMYRSNICMCAIYTDQMDTLSYIYTQMKCIHFAIYSGHMDTFARVTRMNESCKCGMSHV